MITTPDFEKKQIIVVLCREGERIAVKNDNLIVKDAEENVKLQISFYRLFLVYMIGNGSITTPLLQKAQKFGFYIALLTGGFHLYSVIGANKDANTMLKQKQYAYHDLGLARHITANKITNQQKVLKEVRNKNEAITEAIITMNGYKENIANTETLNSLMAYEGLASKLYFKNHFNNVQWQGRQPRVKRDYINSVLDIGYTLLFSFVDALLGSFGFDTFVGVMHTQFYMRKSLVCDIVEPFRPLIDKTVKKAVNLKQIKEVDFVVINRQYQLKWEQNSKYIKLLLTPVMEHKNDIFLYVQSYYRAFMKGLPPEQFPEFRL